MFFALGGMDGWLLANLLACFLLPCCFEKRSLHDVGSSWCGFRITTIQSGICVWCEFISQKPEHFGQQVARIDKIIRRHGIGNEQD